MPNVQEVVLVLGIVGGPHGRGAYPHVEGNTISLGYLGPGESVDITPQVNEIRRKQAPPPPPEKEEPESDGGLLGAVVAGEILGGLGGLGDSAGESSSVPDTGSADTFTGGGGDSGGGGASSDWGGGS